MFQYIPPGIPTSRVIGTFILRINTLRSYFQYQPIRLGRWSLEYDVQKVEDRVRRSNEDHSCSL